jgi:transposase
MAQSAEETAVNTGKDIILVADYHAENIEFRWFDQASGEERTGRYPTGKAGILRQVEQAVQEVAPGGGVVWIMESTTGWARVKELIGQRTRFLLSNVLQMPLPPKGKRRKTDKIDTARLLREYLCDNLPFSFQPSAWWRQVRRVVDFRQDLVERQTALKNWISSLLHHETWEDREGLWTGKGRRRLAAMALSESDRAMLDLKLEQLDALAEQQEKVEARMQAVYDAWPEAQWVDEVRGIGMVTAVSVLAHIGPIERFPTAEDLISYAGLAPGTWRSDATCRHGRIGGGGTDGHLRYLLIEASMWLCQIPRYRPAYERVMAKRGKKIARIVVARMLLRSLYKMLRDRVRFHPEARPGRPAKVGTQETAPETAGCST